MKALIEKDKKYRRNFFLNEESQTITKFVFREFLNNLSTEENTKHQFAKILLPKFDKIISKTKIVMRCVLTGRSRSSLRFSGISRIKFRELIRDNQIRNIKKQSW